MRTIPLALAALLLATAPAAAQDFLKPLQDLADQLAPREQPRPAPRAPRVDAKAEDTPAEVPMPRPRPPELDAPEPAEDAPVPESEIEPEPEAMPEPEPVAEPEAEPEPEPEPEPTTDRIYQTACPALLSGVVVGEMLPPIAEGACGERSPLSISAVRVNGREVALSRPVTTNCAMAGAFADWVGEVDAYAGAALDSHITTITTGTSMMCRNRVGGGDEFMSEHGFANALDIVGFELDDGTSVAVEADWLPAAQPAGKLLRQAHAAACGRFTTVLGPEANADHEDHLHLDLGCHGQTCTAQLCE